MARRVTWTRKAERIFSDILEFYAERNGNKTYSRKLSSEIKQIVSLLTKQPFIGIRTDAENIRVVVKGDFKVFYQLQPEEIVIILVWDCRQNPGKLKKMK